MPVRTGDLQEEVSRAHFPRVAKQGVETRLAAAAAAFTNNARDRTFGVPS